MNADVAALFCGFARADADIPIDEPRRRSHAIAGDFGGSVGVGCSRLPGGALRKGEEYTGQGKDNSNAYDIVRYAHSFSKTLNTDGTGA